MIRSVAYVLSAIGAAIIVVVAFPFLFWLRKDTCDDITLYEHDFDDPGIDIDESERHL